MKTIEQYVDELCQVARDDHSMPVFDAKQKRFSGWSTDELLLQIEVEVLRERRDPNSFAAICAQALLKLPLTGCWELAVAFIIGLGILNGRRRLIPITSELEDEVLGLIISLKSDIAGLPDDTRRDRCEQFLLYQQGIFLEACGRFDEAAEVQEQAAEFAEKIGDISSAGISRFRVLVHRANQAFFTGKGISEAVAAMIEAVPSLQSAVRDTPLAVQWGISNAYAHVLQAIIWNNEECVTDDWDRFVTLFVGQAALIGPQFEDHLTLIRAIDEDEDENVRLTSLITSKSAEVSAGTLLMLVRFAVFVDDVVEAQQYYDQISTTGNVRHIRAIAARELAALDG